MQASPLIEHSQTGDHSLVLEEGDSFGAYVSKDGSSTFDYQDFPLDEEEYKEDYFEPEEKNLSNSESSNAAWVQLMNTPPTSALGVPVGGMQRVSSCYFSISSNMSNNNDYHNIVDNTYSSNPRSFRRTGSYESNQNHAHDALSFDGRNTSDFLQHDVLMNVFSFLDAQSLASFAETGLRPNFECFYFLELQLQRALLMGDSHHCRIGGNTNTDQLLSEVGLENDIMIRMGLDDLVETEGENIGSDLEKIFMNHESESTIPTFDGSIAGTGVISRLASLNSSSARKIVQTYLDSNTSIHAMPLSHSLTYFRQVLLRQHPLLPSSFLQLPKDIPMDNMAKNARNMALFVTVLGAAYMKGGVDVNMHMPVTLPDPSDVMNEENVEALKTMMLKVGLAGGFFKAGKTMTTKAKQANAAALPGDHDGSINNVDNGDVQGVSSSIFNHYATDHASDGDLAPSSTRRSSPQRRSVSMGSIEDLSNMISNSSNIATRLYNAFSNSNAENSSLNASAAYLDTTSPNKECDGLVPGKQQEQKGMPCPSMDDYGEEDTFSLPKRKHRSKRSHKTLRHDEGSKFDHFDAADLEENESSDVKVGNAVTGKGTSSTQSVGISEEQKSGDVSLSPEAMLHAMDHPFSTNPYDHPSHSTLNTAVTAVDIDTKPPSGDTEVATSLLVSPQDLSDNCNHAPSGCIGAYAHAVTTAASEVTHLLKEERKANFESLPAQFQLELGVRFIDACTSDSTLHIVKEILQKHKMMDVDKFFIGPDGTETCALHAAAFNGAEKVLQFLCGGIDERDPNEDCGLCDVNVQDGNGWTALHFAAGANSVTSVIVLADHGAKLTTEASNGYTPFHWAERLSNDEVASELERLGADARYMLGRWMFGNSGGTSVSTPFVSFLANQFFRSRGP